MARRRTAGFLAVALLTVSSVAGLESAASAAGHSRPVRVTFALTPTWLPSGYSISGGGWISPVGGLRIYPNTGEGETVIIAGSKKRSPMIPVLFTLNYYGYHDPESKSISVMASPAKAVDEIGPGPLNAKIGKRNVALYHYTQGAFRNLNVDVSWLEHGDVIEVTTQGLPMNLVERFVAGLVEKNPHGMRTAPIGAGTTTTAVASPD